MEIDGIPFDARGRIWLTASPAKQPFPAQVREIPVLQQANRLHFLCMGEWPEPDQKCHVQVNFRDGEPIRLTTTDTRDVATVTTWDNPRPEAIIESINLKAGPHATTSVLAVTVQTIPDPQVDPLRYFESIEPGEPFQLAAHVRTDGEWRFQWLTNGISIPGETQSVLELASATPAGDIVYAVKVSPSVVDPANQPFISAGTRLVDRNNRVQRGALNEELYLNIPGGTVEDLLSSPRFPDQPDRVGVVSVFEGESIPMGQFGRRISGWIQPTKTADYIFYLASDDGGRLSLSTDESTGNLREIARVDGWAGSRAWSSLGPESMSQPIRLIAGRRYFVEALHKEGGGWNSFSVAWSKVGEPALKDGDEPIGGEFLLFSMPEELP